MWSDTDVHDFIILFAVKIDQLRFLWSDGILKMAEYGGGQLILISSLKTRTIF